MWASAIWTVTFTEFAAVASSFTHAANLIFTIKTSQLLAWCNSFIGSLNCFLQGQLLIDFIKCIFIHDMLLDKFFNAWFALRRLPLGCHKTLSSCGHGLETLFCAHCRSCRFACLTASIHNLLETTLVRIANIGLWSDSGCDRGCIILVAHGMGPSEMTLLLPIQFFKAIWQIDNWL